MTCQIPETIEYQNQLLPCYSEPLRSWLQPKSIGINVADRDSSYPFEVSCSALWRGYVGHWKIENNRLYLLTLQGTRSLGGDATLATIFPDLDAPVFAEWYTGNLECPRGNVIGKIDGHYIDVYEESIMLRLVAGVVTGTKIRKNKVPRDE